MVVQPDMVRETPEWQIAVFCQNERARLAACLTSIACAIGSRSGLITVMINGSTDNSAGVARSMAETLAVPVQVFSIAHGDKSNAINAFFRDRRIRTNAAMYVCVDGHVTISPGSFTALAACLDRSPVAVAASGIGINGRTAFQAASRAISIGGLLHGGLHALRPDFVQRLVDRGLHLPIGLYRGDGLLGSMAAHDLDPHGRQWVSARVPGVAEAQFSIHPSSVFRPSDLRRQFRRKVRQMRGMLENAAIKQLIRSTGYEALPAFADDLIAGYLADHPVPTVALPDWPFMQLALHQHRAATRPAPDRLLPVRIL